MTMPKVLYDGVEVDASEPRLWPIEWINFRCHPCTDWEGVNKYLDGRLEEKPILVCKDCFVVLDGWHRLASWWREGRRYVWVQLTDYHLCGAKDECHINSVNWIKNLRPWAEMACVSGSYLESDFRQPIFEKERDFLNGVGDNVMPLMRQWEHVRATMFLGTLIGRQILDVGTRESAVPAFLTSMGALVTAVDLNVAPIAPQTGLTIQEADATELPFDSNSFDNVLCTACIKHIPDDTLAVSEMLRVLKPHRLLALSFDFGQNYEEYPSVTTGRRIYNKVSIYERLIDPFLNVADICGPVDFDRNDWNDWPIKVQAPTVFARGVNVQVAFVLLRKKELCG